MKREIITIILAVLLIFGGGYSISRITDWQEQQDAQNHVGCQKIEIHGGRYEGGYFWLCPTPTGGADGR